MVLYLFWMLTFFVSANVYRKKTISGVYVNLKSFIPDTYKIGLMESLLFWCFSLCSDFIKFYHETNRLKSIFYKNSYPLDLIDKCIKEFLDKILAPKTIVSTLLKKDLVMLLPYLGKLSLQIHTRNNRIMKTNSRIVIPGVFSEKFKVNNFFVI